MFNVNEYINGLKISADDDVVKETKDLINMAELVLSDAYLCRAYHWGVASAMENQLTYLGGTLLPSQERRLNVLANPRGILAETDLRVSFISNEDHRHINEDITIEDDIAEKEAFIAQVDEKMRTAAIMFALFVNAHDEQSMTLNQLSYRAIQIKSQANKARRSA